MNKSCRECRKYGEKLFLKGERCLSPKCAITRRVSASGTSGSHGANVKRHKKSEYGTQLFEKQKAKSEYGLRERQFALAFSKASRSGGATGEVMLQNLEKRLDNVVYRLGWALSRVQARQMVNHGHIKVNNKVVDIPSFQVKVKDLIEPKNLKLIEKSANEKAIVPSWIKTTPKSFKAEIINLPTRAEIDTPIDEQLIVEFYSR